MKKLIFFTIIMLIYCKEKESKIYESTPEALNYGSIIYASSEANCKNCHGIDYKGNGPEAKDLGIPVPDFTGKIPPEKTPINYFKAISVGTDKTIKNGVNYHAFYSLTDKAKWALSNYLYSLQKPLTGKDKEKRAEELNKAYKEIENIYSKNRKWYMGENTPSSEREKPIELNELIQKTNFSLEKDETQKTLTDEQKEKIFESRKLYQEGYFLYQNNCQSCHGIGGEGIQGSQLLGILENSRYDAIKGIARRKPSFVGIPKLTNLITKESIIQKHNYNFSDEQWNELIQYIKAITE